MKYKKIATAGDVNIYLRGRKLYAHYPGCLDYETTEDCGEHSGDATASQIKKMITGKLKTMDLRNINYTRNGCKIGCAYISNTQLKSWLKKLEAQ